jgi:pyruvate kinase
MSKNLTQYLYQQMDNKAGIEHSQKRTKIVATVGPASDTYDKLLALVKAGVNVFRLNFSHGAYDSKLEIINHIREINKKEPYNIAILGDLQGPKLRVGDLEGGSLELKEGDEIILTTEKMVGTKEKIYVSYKNLATDVKPGERIF